MSETEMVTEGNDTPEAPPVEQTEAPKGKREARYRVERNEAREALTSAQARIEALQLREVVRLAGEHLAEPADLLALGGVTMADLVTPEGYVDHQAVAAAAASVVESRPGLAKNQRQPATDRFQGHGQGPGAPKKPNLGDAFDPRNWQ